MPYQTALYQKILKISVAVREIFVLPFDNADGGMEIKMSYFKKIGNSISSKSKELIKNARAASETNSLNNIIKAEQLKIDTNYKMMGKLYFDNYGDSPAEEFAAAIKLVKASMEKIDETKEEIEKIRRRNCCPNCGNRFKPDAFFCSKCGTRIKEEIQKPVLIICKNCGNKLENDALFCDSCGMKIDSESSLSESPENKEITESQSESLTEADKNTETEVPNPEPAENAQSVNAKICPSCGEKQDDSEALFCNDCEAKL